MTLEVLLLVKNVTILGVPMDLGAGKRGVDMGPSAIRLASLVKRLQSMGKIVEDRGNIHVPVGLNRDNEAMKYREEVLTACRSLAEEVYKIYQEDSFPLILGGDHSIAMGSIAGLARKEPEMGVIWIDAHADFNSNTTSPSGNIHGMPLAVSCGIGDPEFVDIGTPGRKIDPKRVVIVGARDIDMGEVVLLRQHGVKVYTMEEVDLYGIQHIMQKAMQYLEKNCSCLHVSFDMDAIDPSEAPGTGTPVRGGLTYREAHFIMKYISTYGNFVTSLEVVEVNPILDIQNKTAELAVELIESAFGKRIMYYSDIDELD